MYKFLRANFVLYALPTLLAWVILFHGGKTLEATWLLVGVAGVLTLFYYFDQRKKKEKTAVSRAVWVPLMFFVGLSWISFLLSSTQNYGLDEVFQTTALALIFLLVYRSDASFPTHRLFKFLTFLTIMACFFGLAVYVLQPVNRSVGTFLNMRFTTDYWPNAWAEFLLLMWPIVLITEKKQHPDLEHLLLRSLVLGLIGGLLFLSYSRGAVVAFAGQLILGLNFLYLRSNKPNQWRKYIEVSVVSTIVALLVFVSANILRSQFFPVQSIQEKITFTASEGKSSIDERQQFWMQAIDLTMDRPLFGWGPYSFRFIQPRLQQDVLATSDHPHNVFLKLAVERGILVLAAFVILLAVILFSSENALFKRRKKGGDEEMVLVFIAVAGVLAHNVIDYNLQFVGIVLPFWIFLALLAKHYVPARRPTARSAALQKNTEVIIACALLIIAIVEGRFLVLSSFGRHAERKGNAIEALSWYEKSKQELYSRDLHLSRAMLWNENDEPNLAEDALADYFSQNQEDARAWKIRGDILHAQGRIPDAEIAYEKAYTWNKWNDLSTVNAYIETMSDPRPLIVEFHELLSAYEKAIMQNVHFVTLGHNAEEFLTFVQLLGEKGIYDPVEADRIKMKIQEKTTQERSRYNAQSTGLLW